MNVLSYVHLRNIYGSTGAGRVARQLTEHLAANRLVNLHVLADASDHSAVIPRVGSPWTSYPYHLFSADTSRQQARWILTGHPTAEAYWPEAQIVHCTMESYVPTKRCRLVATVHDAAMFEIGAHAQKWSQTVQRLKWKLLYRTLSNKVDLFHTVSQFSADRLATFFPGIRSRLRVIYNAPPQRFREPVSDAGEEFLERHHLKARPYLLLPGGLHFRKNAALVLKAWPAIHAKLNDLRLVISGHSDPAFASQADALGNSVIQTGFVDDEALCSLYHSARAVWIPSRYEGFGIPLLEAMSCGAPIVASNSSALPEIAGRAAVLVPPQSASAHQEAIEAVITDTSLRNELIAAGRERSKGFTWTAAAGSMHELFRGLL